MYELLLYTSVELYLQGVLDNYDDIVAPAGSVGMVAGLAIANYLTGLHVKSVCTEQDTWHNMFSVLNNS